MRKLLPFSPCESLRARRLKAPLIHDRTLLVHGLGGPHAFDVSCSWRKTRRGHKSFSSALIYEPDMGVDALRKEWKFEEPRKGFGK